MMKKNQFNKQEKLKMPTFDQLVTKERAKVVFIDVMERNSSQGDTLTRFDFATCLEMT